MRFWFQFVLGIPELVESDLGDARSRSVDFRMLSNILSGFKGSISEHAIGPIGYTTATSESAARLIRSRFRSFDRAAGVGGNVLDRLQRRLLTHREADVIAYMTADALRWNQIYPKILAINLATPALAWLFGAGNGLPIMYVPLLSIVHMYLRGGFWLGFAATRFGGACIPRYAPQPLGFDEVSWLMLKVACFRVLLLVPLFLSSMWMFILATKSQPNWLTWAFAGVIAPFFYIVAQGWIIAVRLAGTLSGATVGRTRWYWRLVRLAVTAPGSVLLIYFGINIAVISIGLLSEFGLLSDALVPYAILSLTVLFCLTSLSAWLCVRTMYRRGIVDLVRSRPSIGQQWLQQVEQAWRARQAQDG